MPFSPGKTSLLFGSPYNKYICGLGSRFLHISNIALLAGRAAAYVGHVRIQGFVSRFREYK